MILLGLSYGLCHHQAYNQSLISYLWSFEAYYSISFAGSIICEGNSGSLQCPQGHKIQVTAVNWGRTIPESVVCPSGVARPYSGPCFSSIASRRVRFSCQGKQSCWLTANSYTYGQVCPDTRKYLNITYYCECKYKLGHCPNVPCSSLDMKWPFPLEVISKRQNNLTLIMLYVCHGGMNALYVRAYMFSVCVRVHTHQPGLACHSWTQKIHLKGIPNTYLDLGWATHSNHCQ